ncbi:hypothetical protein S83_032328, partial [Arachis hypogaea]
ESSSDLAVLLKVDGVLMDAYRVGNRLAFNKAFEKLGLDCANWTEPIYAYLLRFDYSIQPPTQELVARDLHDNVWIIHEKQQLLLSIKRANRQPANISSSILSSYSMQIGILAAVAHATANNSPFTIFYNPRASPSEFVILLAKYYKVVFLFSFSEFVRWKNSQWHNLQ